MMPADKAAAHTRLMATLPVRTHLRELPTENFNRYSGKPTRQKRVNTWMPPGPKETKPRRNHQRCAR